jgi:hypothetical protein
MFDIVPQPQIATDNARQAMANDLGMMEGIWRSEESESRPGSYWKGAGL